ncbi:MAG: hypothetical protein ACFBSD_07545 [Paracoccaceae bacterium]
MSEIEAFLLAQHAARERGDLDAVAAGFDLPCVVVDGRETRVIPDRAGLRALIAAGVEGIARIGGTGSRRQVTLVSDPDAAVVTASVKDLIHDASGAPLGTFRASYAIRRDHDGPRVAVLMIDAVPGNCCVLTRPLTELAR